MPPKIVTLGVYGSSEAGFFEALRTAGVDTFCDIRLRRGVRGSEYAFVNHRRLEARLTQLNIRYLHFKELAPTLALRERQKAADKAGRTAKRQRTELSESFVTGFCEECLQSFDSRKFIERLGGEARVVALFCVERELPASAIAPPGCGAFKISRTAVMRATNSWRRRGPLSRRERAGVRGSRAHLPNGLATDSTAPIGGKRLITDRLKAPKPPKQGPFDVSNDTCGAQQGPLDASNDACEAQQGPFDGAEDGRRTGSGSPVALER